MGEKIIGCLVLLKKNWGTLNESVHAKKFIPEDFIGKIFGLNSRIHWDAYQLIGQA